MMKLRPTIAAVALAAGVFWVSTASAQTFVVDGRSDIFAAGQTGDTAGVPVNSPGGGGLSPTFIFVSPGQNLTISATGSVFCCVGSAQGSAQGSVGPDGFAQNPFGNGSSIKSSFGNGLTFTGSGAFPLAGVFGSGDATALGGGVDTNTHVFQIGSSYSVVVPDGDYRLYFGLPDASGFNGASGYYDDNSGAFAVTVSGAPEPGAWALMLGGVAFVGFALRSRRQRQGRAAQASAA